MSKKYIIPEDPISMMKEPDVAYNESVSHVAPVSGTSTREKLNASTMSVDEYFDELIDQVRHDNKETMTIEETREMTLRAINREYALDRDMTPEQLYAVISEEIDDIYANG